jgi:hypothetical protein
MMIDQKHVLNENPTHMATPFNQSISMFSPRPNKSKDHHLIKTSPKDISTLPRELPLIAKKDDEKSKKTPAAAAVDYGYGTAEPDYGYGTAEPDYGYGTAEPDNANEAPTTPKQPIKSRRRSSLLFTPGHDNPSNNNEKRKLRTKRRASLTFATETIVKEIPRYDDHTKHEIFWGEGELNLMRCEAKMRKAGMDPEEFDWKSFR